MFLISLFITSSMASSTDKSWLIKVLLKRGKADQVYKLLRIYESIDFIFKLRGSSCSISEEHTSHDQEVLGLETASFFSISFSQ